MLKSLFFGLSLLLVALPAWAGYDNPQLRVLLLTTRQPFSLVAKEGLRVQGIDLNPGQNRLDIFPQGRSGIEAAGNLLPRLSVHSKGLIGLIQPGQKATLWYDGFLEVRTSTEGAQVINHIDTERYLEGVLGGEIKTNWPIEAVKAQAVLARTFALYRRYERGAGAWHLKNGATDQMYQGKNVSDPRARFAIDETRGLVVSYKGRLAQTFYHADCGGVTELPSALWDLHLPYYKVQEVHYGQNAPNARWQTFLSRARIREVLYKAGLAGDQIEQLEVKTRSESGRAAVIDFQGDYTQELKAQDFRRLVGYKKLPSLLFDVETVEGGFLFTGQGSGHGIGLCQWAAKEMAEEGLSFEQILNYFYQPIDLGYYGG
ncbi:MAG: hypothetical protein A2508_07140 [Candidatus Lambdaproteobacteria bacterium RIFOXYD12_FULL_49_8]|nr:MAG: hypothetical protein A2508_07140 [Candidatus Lambdaproteobacteria bacterium RIFOXYD12_FULL_49_8]